MTDVRGATPNNWRTYRDLQLGSLHLAPDAYGSTFAEKSAEGEEFWVARVTGSYTLMAWDADLAGGTATGIPDQHETGTGEIVGVWVEPSVRGRGVGEALILDLVDWARDAAARAIAPWVSDANDAARAIDL